MVKELNDRKQVNLVDFLSLPGVNYKPYTFRNTFQNVIYLGLSWEKLQKNQYN